MLHLVTGSTGLVGNNVVRLLLARGEAVRVLVRPGSDPRPLEGLNVEIFRGDIGDLAALRAGCRGVQVVYHAAGHIHMGWGQKAQADLVNVEGTRHVARASRECGARLVQISTINALGVGRRDKPATEDSYDSRVVPTPYILSKRAADEIVEMEAEQGLDAVFIYPSLMFGPWDWKPSSGRMILEVGQRFTVLAPWGGVSVCDARDTAAAIVTAAAKAPSGRHYVLAGNNLLYVELWRLIARIAGSRPPLFRAGPIIRYIGAFGGDVWGLLTRHEPALNTAAVRMSDQYHFFDSTRAVQELGYRVRPTAESIADAWNWLKEHGYTVRARPRLMHASLRT